jgi:hypothetical protein
LLKAEESVYFIAPDGDCFGFVFDIKNPYIKNITKANRMALGYTLKPNGWDTICYNYTTT